MTRLRLPLALCDALLVVLIAAGAVIADTGGDVWYPAGIRLSVQSPWRPLVLAGLILVVRIWKYGRVGPFGRGWRDTATHFGWIEDLRRAQHAPLPPARELGLAFLALTAVTAVVFHVQVAGFRQVPDLGDPLFSMWRMAWVPHQLASDPRHLFDANIFYPDTGTLTYSDSIILPALTAAPLLWAGVSPVIAYNVLFLSGFVLSAFAMYVLVRALAFGPPAAWMAAIIFGFYHYRLDHYSHLELQMAQWMPIALLAVHRLLAVARPRYIVVLMLALGAQWYSSMYYGLFLMVYIAAFAGVLAIAWRPGWKPVASVAIGVALGAVLVVPLARAYSAAAADRGTRPIVEIRRFSGHAGDYLRPARGSAMYGGFPWRNHNDERALFPGVTAVALAAMGAAPPLTATRLAVVVAGLFAFDGSLGFNGHWYPVAHRVLPPLASVRAPVRFAMLVGLTLALLSAAGVQRLWGRMTSQSGRRLALAVMTTAVLAESWPALALTPVWPNPPSLYATLGPESGAVLFEYPMRPDPNWFETNIPYMYFSIWHWTKMVNGYSGFIPRSYVVLAESMDGFPGGETVDYLKRIGVTHVTLHCGLWDRRPCAATEARLDADPRFRPVASTQWNGGPSRLYELVR